MKKLLLFSLLSLFVCDVYAQGWRKIDQSFLGMKYKLPKSWAIDGFGYSDWEEYGSSVCHCAGTINIGNQLDENSEIFMVAYPYLNADSASKRQKVWDMVFDDNAPKTLVKTKKYSFEKKVSRWRPEDAGNYPNSEVWQLKASAHNQHYLLYFWAKPDVMKANEKTIATILESLVFVKKK